ncbi:hypothetical protein [Arthrobacter mobilis]|uniref:Uncharacterized protein n=1 Tax=Arthrobacter mobilis TaxID=2724944 RepID=A0A7X6HAV7_9MICC|nr:hypothetical protein [Arthrobacter mobilis]NKX52964.1 hypothetical protein [Arthrobacter mobilis]
MSTEGQRSEHPGGTGPGGTVPDSPDGVGIGAGQEPNTFEPEEDTPGKAQGGNVPAPDEASGPAEQQDRQEPDDRGLTTNITPSD